MLGFAWLTLRQAQEALKHGRLEEAQHLLCQPEAQGHKGSWELQQQVAHAFVERGQRHLRDNDPLAAWNDLIQAEQAGDKDGNAAALRQALTTLGLADVRHLLEAGDPGRAVERLAQLRERAVRQPEAQALEETARGWVLARERGDRGDFTLALQTVERLRRLAAGGLASLERFQKDLEQRQQTFGELLLQLHEASAEKRWGQVLRLAEQVLAVAPQHAEARQARARAWQAVQSTAAPRPAPAQEAPRPDAAPASRSQRFMLWIDGVDGCLVCLGPRVTLGQATPDAYVDVPLFADVSRVHAALTRDAEGYLFEALRPSQVNGQPAEKALLQSGDRLTLGGCCQLIFSQPVPVSATGRLEIASGHRAPLAVSRVVLMADTLVLGPGPQAHVLVPDLVKPVVLYRHKNGLAVRHGGALVVDGQPCRERGLLGPASRVTGEDFAFSVEPLS
jgi:hypothetical protein